MKLKSLMTISAAIGVTLALAPPAMAQTSTDTAITLIRTGWNTDSFAVVTAAPIKNPAGCPIPDGYISDKSLPGYSTLYAAALTAIALRRAVTVVVHDTECFGGRPKLIGINIPSN